MGRIIAIIIGIACIIMSLPHEEFIDLGIAKGSIDVETEWVGIILGIIIILAAIFTKKSDN